MIFINGIAALIVLTVVFHLFGVGPILEARLAAIPLVRVAAKWNALWPMLPGAAVGFACLWYWLVLIGRSRGVPWGGALLYGVALALGNVPLGGFIIGLIHGGPLLGLLLALVFLLNLLLLPSVTLAMAVFGLVMGAFNGILAQLWIERHRPR
jgi:hypothetical protein